MRPDIEGASEQESQIDIDLRSGAARDLVVGEIAPVRGHKSRVQPFDRALADCVAQIAVKMRVLRRYCGSAYSLVEPCFEQAPRGYDRLDQLGMAGESDFKLLARCDKCAAEPTEVIDQFLGDGLRSTSCERL